MGGVLITLLCVCNSTSQEAMAYDLGLLSSEFTIYWTEDKGKQLNSQVTSVRVVLFVDYSTNLSKKI